MTMGIATVEDGIVRELGKRGFDARAHGMTIEPAADKDGTARGVLHLPHPTGAASMAMETTFDLTADGAKSARAHARAWMTEILPCSNIAAARDFFAGRPGIPYMGDAVIGRALEHAGSSWEDLIARIRRVVTQQGFDRVNQCAIATYSGMEPPGVFARRYYRRTYGMQQGDLPHMQMCLSTRARHLTLDMEIGPGCMWNAWGSGQVWLEERYPDSLCMGMTGRRVVDVVAHPAFDIPGLTVKKMRHDGARTVLEVTQILEEIPGRHPVALDKAA